MMDKCENVTLTDMVDIVLNDSGIKDELTGDKSLESEIRLENLEEFKSITKNYEEVTNGSEVEEYLKKSEKEFDEFRFSQVCKFKFCCSGKIVGTMLQAG